MNLLLYGNGTSEAGKRLRELLKALVPERQAEVYKTIDSLSRRLCQSSYDVAIAVLLASSRKELQGLLSIRDLFLGVRIILILPDRGKDTISEGHKLYPRFLSYADSDFKDVAAVLAKMLKRVHS